MSGGALSGTDTSVISGSMVYPSGTTEQFPDMVDSADNVQGDSAHYYMECSNKGICNRKDGECECFDGYEGSSCQRASCPNECSGHGVCKNIRQIAEDDASNFYELWDKYATLGCVCDAGYYGADCSARRCKYGVDPLYIDDEANARYAQFDIIMAGSGADPTGTYAIVFTDVFGEDWETSSIAVSGTPCDDITEALEGIPNNVIPSGSVTCSFVDDAANTFTTSLQFGGNPGHIAPLSVNKYLSGNTATLTGTVTIQSSGTRGEFSDIVPTHCDGVYVSVDAAVLTVEDYNSDSSTTDEVYKLKSCLGTSDYLDSTNTAVNNWDEGSAAWPHLVKVVEVDSTDGGYYNLLTFDSTATADPWSLVHDVGVTGNMEIFTTDATMQLVFTDTNSDTLQGTTEAKLVIEGDPTGGLDVEVDYDASCESGASSVSHCLQKGEIIMFGLDTATTDAVNGEFYTITRVWTVAAFGDADPNDADRYFFSVDHAVNDDFTDVYVLTKESESYEYVSECSNRGLCNSEEALCECFAGYTNDNCDTQSAIAV